MSSRIEVWTIPLLVALGTACESGSSTASSGQTNPPCTGSIGDLVWKDRDADGVRDPGEGGLAGVALTLSQAGAPIASTTTDGLGQYLFSPLCAGDYTVTVARLQGLTPTTPTSTSVTLPDDDTAPFDARQHVRREQGHPPQIPRRGLGGR
jgi:hypothetical protein